MTASTGESGRADRGTNDPEGDDCSFTFQTVLATPDPDTVAQLSDGEILDVVKIDSPRGVEVRRLGGERVGAVARHIVRLRRCIDGGFSYEGEVLRVSGGSVTVEVRPQ